MQHNPKSNAITIRPLCDNDDAEWFRLRNALWPDHKHDEFLAESVAMRSNANREAIFVAACPDGVLCGMAEVSIHDSAIGCNTDRIGYLEGWYVDPQWRKHGIGRRLVQAAEEWARTKGCTEMASDTTSDYPISPYAHERLGYQEVESRFYFRKDLG